MRIAFYAPMKPPDWPRPSGDRRMGRLLIAALERAGNSVQLVSRLRVWQGTPDEHRQRRLEAIGAAIAQRLIRRFRAMPADVRPELWLSFHIHYKAPDWIGPTVSAALGIPYVIIGCSHAPKRAGGPWAVGHAATERAIRAADAVLNHNPADRPCVTPLLRPGVPWIDLPAFLDLAPFAEATGRRETYRAGLRRRLGLDAGTPLLFAVAMMRRGEKLASFAVLAAALARLAGRPWTLMVAGDGAARAEVEALFAGLGADRIRWLGLCPEEALPPLYAAADLLVWPAVGEAVGMALLEAQAAGLPVVAGRTGGVPTVVVEGETGLLTEIGDDGAFAAAVAALLDDPARRARMSSAARVVAQRDHSLDAAAAVLQTAIDAVTRRRAA